LRKYDLEDLMVKCLNNLKIVSNRGESTADQFLTLHQLRTNLVVYIKKIFEQYDANKQEGNSSHEIILFIFKLEIFF
jgi:hypothetical protein